MGACGSHEQTRITTTPVHAGERGGNLFPQPHREGATMAGRLATHIALPGTTAEAMTHWHEVFGGDLQILYYRDAPMEGMGFEPDPNAVAHATLTLPQGVIAGGDAVDHEGDYPIRGTAYSLLYMSDSPQEAQTHIARLLDGGGAEGMPFDIAPWGGWYGQVFDRYGVMWAFSAEA